MEPGQTPHGGSGVKPPDALMILHFTVPKEPKKSLGWCNFVALGRKNSVSFINLIDGCSAFMYIAIDLL